MNCHKIIYKLNIFTLEYILDSRIRNTNYEKIDGTSQIKYYRLKI